MSHYSDAEAALAQAWTTDSPDFAAILNKRAHVFAMLAVADAITHVADVVEDPGNS